MYAWWTDDNYSHGFLIVPVAAYLTWERRARVSHAVAPDPVWPRPRVLREGNVLILANTSLEVAEACSGIRSLVSLITLAIVFGYFTDWRSWVRVVIALVAIPVAVFTNGARVAGTGIAAHDIGPAAVD